MPKILYAEDDDQVAGLVRFFFERDAPQVAVEVAANGKECLAAMARGGYDLLLLDLVLPGRDGLAILSDLARRGDSTPVIVLSSHGQYEQTVSSLRAGAVDCIDKKGPRFLEIARIVGRYLEPPANAGRAAEGLKGAQVETTRTVILLERDEATALEIATIVAKDCPQLRIRTVPSRTEWDRLMVAEMPCHAVVINDQWDLADLTDILRDFRSRSRGGPAVLLSRLSRLELVIAAYALGCRDCIVQKHGYQQELARSLNHLLRPPAPAEINS